MLGFLAPVWLFGLATLVLPVALHLWKRRMGRPLRVGSIRLLAGAPPAMARRPRIHDPWLLALRCAVLATLVLALARPFWTPRHAAPLTWALVGDDVMGRAALVDSLQRSGNTIRPLDPANLWMSLDDADRAAPPGTGFEVFAAPLLREVRGTRPVLRSAVSWHPRASTGGDVGAPVPPVGAKIVTIFADPARGDDARYVSAAVRAVGLTTGIPAIVAVRLPDPLDGASVGRSDWIVWLSERPIPEAILLRLRQGATLLNDAAATSPGTARTRVTLATRPSDTWSTRRSAVADDGVPVWSDVTGAPLLTVAREGRGLHYRFHSRFAPAWSEIVLHPAFPEAIAQLWVGSDSSRRSGDDRPISLSQLLPARDPEPHPGPTGAGARSLFLPAWLLAVCLFLVERRFAARPRGARP